MGAPTRRVCPRYARPVLIDDGVIAVRLRDPGRDAEDINTLVDLTGGSCRGRLNGDGAKCDDACELHVVQLALSDRRFELRRRCLAHLERAQRNPVGTSVGAHHGVLPREITRRVGSSGAPEEYTANIGGTRFTGFRRAQCPVSADHPDLFFTEEEVRLRNTHSREDGGAVHT